MENTDNQEDIIEDIVESDLLSLEQGEVEESVSEDVEEIAEGDETTSEASELKKAKAEGAHEEDEEADPKPKKAKAEGAHEDEEEEEEEVNEALVKEAQVMIQVINPQSSIRDLKKMGVKASVNPRQRDEIVVDTKDKKKVLSWMLDSGFDKLDIEDLYPELMEAAAEIELEVGNSDAGVAADEFLKKRRKKKKDDSEQDPESGEGEGLDSDDEEEIAKASDAVSALGVGVQEDVVTSGDLTRLVEEEEGLTPEFKAKAALIFEAEVRTKVEEVTEQLKAEHEAKLSEEVEAINETLTNQIDAYLTYAVEEWINENEVAIESSLRSSIAENFMTSLKTLFVENYVDVPESKVDLFDELEEETEQLKEDLAKANSIAETLADRIDELSREKLLGEATKDLAETQAAKLLKLAEGVEFDEDFTKNVETLKKFYFTGEGETLTEESLETEDETVETIVEGADVEEETSDAPTDKTMASYMETLGRLKKSAN